ncbi:uncharacterized protein LOC108199938 isoform X2 [Daucus carota subsp. sativus]|uniref:uncharacterized protein LOC108199938 isoform X2 n=1 Tax=Daucus carota subsp. sativus TaxID=79200 RepID=UPI003082D37C
MGGLLISKGLWVRSSLLMEGEVILVVSMKKLNKDGFRNHETGTKRSYRELLKSGVGIIKIQTHGWERVPNLIICIKFESEAVCKNFFSVCLPIRLHTINDFKKMFLITA